MNFNDEDDKELLFINSADGLTVAVDASNPALKQAVEKELENWEYAEDLVVAYEERKGWSARKVTSPKKQNMLGYDIESHKNGEVRHIEVKSKMGGGKRFGWLQLTPNETARYRSDPNYFIYLVEGDCLDEKATINIVEISRQELDEMAIPKDIVRFSRLSGLTRKKIR